MRRAARATPAEEMILTSRPNRSVLISRVIVMIPTRVLVARAVALAGTLDGIERALIRLLYFERWI